MSLNRDKRFSRFMPDCSHKTALDSQLLCFLHFFTFSTRWIFTLARMKYPSRRYQTVVRRTISKQKQSCGKTDGKTVVVFGRHAPFRLFELRVALKILSSQQLLLHSGLCIKNLKEENVQSYFYSRTATIALVLFFLFP